MVKLNAYSSKHAIPEIKHCSNVNVIIITGSRSREVYKSSHTVFRKKAVLKNLPKCKGKHPYWEFTFGLCGPATLLKTTAP